MNKNVLLGLVLIAAAAGGYYQFSYKPAQEAAAAAAAAAEAAAAEAKAAADIGWRDFFQNAELQQLVAQALANNRDLKTAALRIEEARALYGIQGADQLPTVNATGGVTGQTNVGHWVRDGATARAFKKYWDLLATNPGSAKKDDEAAAK